MYSAYIQIICNYEILLFFRFSFIDVKQMIILSIMCNPVIGVVMRTFLKFFFFLNYVKSSSTKFIAALNCKKILRIHCRRRSYLSVMVTVVSLRAEHWSN